MHHLGVMLGFTRMAVQHDKIVAFTVNGEPGPASRTIERYCLLFVRTVPMMSDVPH